MLPGKARILEELTAISKKWFTSREDSLRLDELLRQLARLDGYRAPSSSVTNGWFEERAYGLEEIARLESPEAATLLVNLWKKQIGVTAGEVIYLLDNMQHPASIKGLKELARYADFASDREAATNAVRRKSQR